MPQTLTRELVENGRLIDRVAAVVLEGGAPADDPKFV
jgi:hypothetical protein